MVHVCCCECLVRDRPRALFSVGPLATAQQVASPSYRREIYIVQPVFSCLTRPVPVVRQ
jgi:hypothetical protein